MLALLLLDQTAYYDYDVVRKVAYKYVHSPPELRRPPPSLSGGGGNNAARSTNTNISFPAGPPLFFGAQFSAVDAARRIVDSRPGHKADQQGVEKMAFLDRDMVLLVWSHLSAAPTPDGQSIVVTAAPQGGSMSSVCIMRQLLLAQVSTNGDFPAAKAIPQIVTGVFPFVLRHGNGGAARPAIWVERVYAVQDAKHGVPSMRGQITGRQLLDQLMDNWKALCDADILASDLHLNNIMWSKRRKRLVFADVDGSVKVDGGATVIGPPTTIVSDHPERITYFLTYEHRWDRYMLEGDRMRSMFAASFGPIFELLLSRGAHRDALVQACAATTANLGVRGGLADAAAWQHLHTERDILAALAGVVIGRVPCLGVCCDVLKKTTKTFIRRAWFAPQTDAAMVQDGLCMHWARLMSHYTPFATRWDNSHHSVDDRYGAHVVQKLAPGRSDAIVRAHIVFVRA